MIKQITSMKNFSKVMVFCTMILAMPLSLFSQKSKTDLAVVQGMDYFSNTVKAVDMLGGMKKFVKKGMKVGLLINSDFTDKGVYVNPDVSIAVIKMCFDAGASDIICLQDVKQEYWQRSSFFGQYKEMLAKVRTVSVNTFPAKYDSINWVKLDTIPGAKCLRNAEVVKELFNVDMVINIPIAKHHGLTFLSCAIKNYMGLCTRATNVTMHLNGPKKNDPGYLAQCNADIHMIKKECLVVADMTEVIVTNGPSGPGEIKKPEKVVASADPVALDAYCAQELGWSQDDALAIEKGYGNKLGEKDLTKVRIKEIKQ